MGYTDKFLVALTRRTPADKPF